MSKRIDSASRFIPASPSDVYASFAESGAMVRWLPPKNMTGTMLRFDFKEGGSYRMRLTYKQAEDGRGKTSDDSDEVEVQFVKLVNARRIEQAITFKSDDPDFAGVMRMLWIFEPAPKGTMVTVSAEDVPRGIRKDDHEAGMNSTLDNLVAFHAGSSR
jgi:uncharacterized protein YndB with AHSA1/START domain